MKTSADEPPVAAGSPSTELETPCERLPWEAPTLQRLSLSLTDSNPGVAGDGEITFS
jgi:hypothetical protein